MARDGELAARAIAAAEYLFEEDEPDETDGLFEPSDEHTARVAVKRFGKLFAELRGVPKTVMERARSSGDLVSSDSLQGLAEIVQNADDVEATEIVLQLGKDELLVSHNGNPVRLPHVLALATPWLTTKGGEAALMGRFGIGLTTLRSLSDTFEVHCDPYHVRFGAPFVSPIRARRPPAGLDQAGWTAFRIPVSKVTVGEAEVSAWLGRWDDSAMLFLRAVSRIVLRSARGENVMELGISRGRQEDVGGGPSSGDGVSRQRVTAQDGRSWMVYRAEVQTPNDVERAHKATEATTPVAIALPLHEVEGGKIHAGLPVAATRMGVFANAQFDPTTSRQEFPDNEWNKALVPIVAELWAVAVLDAFDRDPRSAWQAIPIGDVSEDQRDMPIVGRLESEVIASARERVAANLTLPVDGRGRMPLRELAVEDKPLARVLTPEETAGLSGLEATLPAEIRDAGGKWWEVLKDWRDAGVELPAPVSVEQALALLEDGARAPGGVVALSAVALRENLDERLLALPCVVARNGRRLVPPLEDAPEAVALEVSPLAQQLGVVSALHPAHLADKSDARKVLDWLRECGAVVDGNDDREVVHRLAAAGRSHRRNPRNLELEQVQALRAVFERLEPEERQRVGGDVGRAVKLDAFEYEMTGRRKRRKKTTVEPARAYLPKTIEREEMGFSVAADKAPGIAWISGHYVRQLRSPLGRQGVGAQKFLRLLGAETAPRTRRHPRLRKRYEIDPTPALAAELYDGISARTEELNGRTATHTLEDRDAPDLRIVVEDIAKVRRGPQRRKRAAALVSTLARAWDARLAEYAQVRSAHAYNGWNETGETSAYWVWQLRDVAWLDDERRTPRSPSELRVRTPAMEAVYGADAPNYLHSDLHNPSWQPVLSALGVEGAPSRRQLVDRLKALRAAMQAGKHPVQEVEKEAAVVYKALARSLQGPSPRSELNRTQLKGEFASGDGLILTKSGWRSPERVFGGEAILGPYSVFAPAVSETAALWEALGLSRPSVMDCVKAIRTISRRSPVDEQDAAILLDALRVIAREYGPRTTAKERRALRELPLLTTRGWMRQRPVYATDDRSLTEGLGDRVPIWQPGGELHQFASILGALRVRPIDAGAGEVVDADLAEEDEDYTDLYRKAVQQLHEDLVRNEPGVARSLTVPWDQLESFTVRIHSSLSIRVPLEEDGGGQYDCPVAAKVDPDRAVVFVRRQSDLAHVDRGGRALSMLFTGDSRPLALAWRGAWDRADEGRPATILELAQERRAREESENELRLKDRMAPFQEGASGRDQTGRRADGGKSGDRTSEQSSATGTGDGKKADPPRRDLVRPSTLRLRDPEGQESERAKGRRPSKRTGGGRLVEPHGAAPPRTGTPPPNYTSEEKERVGLELLRIVVGRDLVDIRGQRGVGADALDKEAGRYYELKVSGGNEPDVVSMTTSEVMRAAATKDKFVLAVVSGVEGADACPTVRLVHDPLKQLDAGTEEGKINLAGIRSRGRIFPFDNETLEGHQQEETPAAPPE
ncbi:MAG: hypothetical protein OXG82_01520 [Gammaproteobacteria bacterium]|nr:hypothetical protein [Gammaproteobacteria bacterium]